MLTANPLQMSPELAIGPLTVVPEKVPATPKLPCVQFSPFPGWLNADAGTLVENVLPLSGVGGKRPMVTVPSGESTIVTVPD